MREHRHRMIITHGLNVKSWGKIGIFVFKLPTFQRKAAHVDIEPEDDHLDFLFMIVIITGK